jgi:general secretion pathway protein D
MTMRHALSMLLRPPTWAAAVRLVGPRLVLLLGPLVALSVLVAALVPSAWAQAGGSANRFRGEPVTLNFVNADIEGVSRAMGAILRQQFLVDPRVKGTITLYSDTPLTPREAYLNYLAALRGLGFAVVESGGLFKVVPEADAKLQTGTVSVGSVNRSGDQIITQIFRLNHENANNLVPVLRPLISPNNTINANPGNNSLVITDYADNLQRIARIIAAMDVPASGDVEIIPLRHAVASDLLPLVQRLGGADGGGGAIAATPGAPALPAAGGGGVAIFAEPRSNSLIVRAANASRLASIRDLVSKLDRPRPAGTPAGSIWVVHLKNADAARLATVLRAAFSAQSSAGAQGGLTGAGGAASPAAPQQAAVPQGAAGGGVGTSPQATAPVTASAQPSTGGFIQADPATNSLIITASEPLYREIREVIDRLDSRRAQVYIESMIVRVDAGKVADIGVQWQGASGTIGSNTIVGAGTNFGGTGNILNLSSATAGGVTTAGQALAQGAVGAGFNFGVLRNFGGIYGLTTLARFLETNADGNILSTPNVMSLDNEEAKIVVGQNVPFVTGSFTNTGTGQGATNPFQTIERRDVGLTLRVRPQIGEGGTVRLTLFQENSNVVSSAGNLGPTTDKSSIETSVVVDDGQILVLGGLLRDEYTGGQSKVPLLGDLPVVGGLFRSENRNRSKTNLMVFLRPVVIRSQDAANALTIDRYDTIRARQADVQPPPRALFPVNEAPVLPPAGVSPMSLPGTAPGALPPALPPPPGSSANRPAPAGPQVLPAPTGPQSLPVPNPPNPNSN